MRWAVLGLAAILSACSPQQSVKDQANWAYEHAVTAEKKANALEDQVASLESDLSDAQDEISDLADRLEALEAGS